jgi:hypothetical protein
VWQWKALPDSERKTFEAKAAKSRQRYDEECAARDAEVEAEQEARRAARQAEVMGPRVHAAAPEKPATVCVDRTGSC